MELVGGAALLDSGIEIIRLNSRRYQVSEARPAIAYAQKAVERARFLPIHRAATPSRAATITALTCRAKRLAIAYAIGTCSADSEEDHE
jgi:hypothetical protein